MLGTLNIIGGGRVGRTLTRLWSNAGVFTIGDVLDLGLERSRAAAEFIGAGRAVEALGQMQSAEAWMLTPPDDQIAGCGEALAASGALRPGDIVFHCSGALASHVLAAVRACGAAAASVHPLKSFADPALAARTFAGTHCAADGDTAALVVLRAAFEGIGGTVTDIDPRRKTIYHAASVIVCNYLTALIEAGLRCYEKAGFPRETALAMIEPLVRETLDNAFKLGTVKSLTGPIARGDYRVVARQMEALAAWNSRIAAIYRDLGGVAVELAHAQGSAEADALTAIERLLADTQSGSI